MSSVALGATTVAFNALWQDTVLCAAVALLVRAFRGLNAATTYAIWFATLIAAIVVPLLTLSTPSQAAQSYEAQTAPPRHSSRLWISQRPSGNPMVVVRRMPGLTFSDAATRAALYVWFFGTLFIVGRLLLALWRLERLKRDALPLPIERRRVLEPFLPRSPQRIRFCQTDRIEAPIAAGLFDSMILLPELFLEALSPEQIRQVALHEIAHLRRRDDWTNLIQRIVLAVLWFSPAVYLIGRALNIDREVACDDDVVAHTESPEPYARCLVALAEMTQWPHQSVAAPGVFSTRRGIGERIERLLREPRRGVQRLRPAPFVGAIAFVCAISLASRAIAPTIAAPLTPQAVSSIGNSSTILRAINRLNRLSVSSAWGEKQQMPLLPRFPAQRRVANNFTMAICEATCDFSHSNWSGHSFSGQDLVGADFSNARLLKTDFSNSKLWKADFSNSDLRGADFHGTMLIDVDFTNARLAHTRFDGATLIHCYLQHVDLSSVDLTHAKLIHTNP